MNIRKYQESDRTELISLWETVFPDNSAHNDPERILNQKLAVDDLIFVAEKEGELIGACMAGYDGHRGWLYAVAVLENHRRSGTGGALVKQSIASLKEIGCHKVNLQIREANFAVAEFYKSQGFLVEERLSMGVLLE